MKRQVDTLRKDRVECRRTSCGQFGNALLTPQTGKNRDLELILKSEMNESSKKAECSKQHPRDVDNFVSHVFRINR